ncbi:two-component sensor histidine kinase [Actinomadura sp. NBRC 104425]|uniref:sensor histidine kinase n=1 Tax=Actinomadura sp. NBRC 104425 TaxID=3032204 RepID=UPI0024A4C127|nr:HAMP domain-containing sensor histidine kinase [Actinomadura sp. NBRC 104425]GLZ16187.1 two-component sensor histidine kinase [Actinomadura sp. NBRC 104425]
MTLNARLMTGLLGVTLAGLLVMCGVSGFVLHTYLMNRVDGQLQATRDRAAIRIFRPGLPGEGVAPPRFVVLNVNPAGRVRVLSGDDPDPLPAVRAVGGLGHAELRARAASLEPFSLPGLRAVARETRNGNVVVVAAPLDEIRAAVRNLVAAELVTTAVLVAALALAGRRLIGRGLLPLSRMAATAQAIASGGDLRARMPGPGPATEASRLAAAINVMLDRIEQAFWARARSEARVREFAADASHELRTPLTTIQGYAELYRHGALGPDELPDAMRRIEDEARRMSALVGDLLELARLDRDASLRPARVDVVALARDAVADASAAGPDHPVTLEAPDELVATVDQARVRQILANLLANVRTHTPPGTAVTVRLRRDPGGLLVEVADQGPGMAPEDAARAFERFHRAGDGSSGTGLGLPIVAAIAAAHGGRAQLLSKPGRGTVVSVALRDLS